MSRTETDGDVRQVDLQVPVNGATMQCALRLRGDLAALTDATGEHVLQCAAVLGDPGSLPVRAWTAMLQDDLGIVPEIVSDRDLGGLVDQPGLSFPLLLVVPDAHELRASLWEKVVLPALQRGMGLVLVDDVAETVARSLGISVGPPREICGVAATGVHESVHPLRSRGWVPLPRVSARVYSARATTATEVLAPAVPGRLALVGALLDGAHLDGGWPDRAAARLCTDWRTSVAVACAVGKGRAFVWGVDPVAMLARATMEDLGTRTLGMWSNLARLAVSSAVWASPLSVCKPVTPSGAAGRYYTVDTEAGALYYDAPAGLCSYAVGRWPAPTRNAQDTKFANSVRAAGARLREYAVPGTFFIDAAGLRDDDDVAALRELAADHEIGVHKGPHENHETWRARFTDLHFVHASLAACRQKLVQSLNRQPVGVRFPGWCRAAGSNVVIAQLGLLYDSTCFATPPYLGTPFRLWDPGTTAALGVFEVPCRETVDVVKRRGRVPWHRARQWRAQRRLAEYGSRTEAHGLPAVLACHDQALGADPNHLHGTWRFDIRRWHRLMKRWTLAEGEQVHRTVGEYMRWYAETRSVVFDHASLCLSGGSAVLRLSGRDSAWETCVPLR